MAISSSRADYPDISRPIAFGIPIFTYGIHFFLAHFAPETYRTLFTWEYGLTEMGTVLCLLIAIGFAIAALVMSLQRGGNILRAWLIVFLLGAIYFCGEEASWGQHLVGWQTPETWGERNYQNETNIHNSVGIVGTLTDRLPRTILSFGALVFGFAYPVWRRLRGISLTPDNLWYWIFPTSACIAAGFIAPLASLPGKIPGEALVVPGVNYGELKELMLAQFLMIYIASLWIRLRNAPTLLFHSMSAPKN